MSDSDLYSLFGNAIDNAVEAVAKIDNPEKRTVNVIVKNTNHFISVMVENYYKGSLKYNSDGLPITTKENNGYHGFGVKSIKIIVDKYQGTCNIRTNNGIFSLAITFPEKEQSMAD
jgi:sensor histidine kinase regulating citrate/malate metabolism